MTDVQAEGRNQRKRVGLYVGCGSRGSGVCMWVRILMASSGVELALLDGKDVTGGTLGSLDLLVMPGGSGFDQYDSMEHEAGTTAIRNYVLAGGKYMGTCAGIAFALNEPKRARLVAYKRMPVALRGGATIRLNFSEEGAKLLNIRPGLWPVAFHNGPILIPEEPLEDCSSTVLATMNSELVESGRLQQEMFGTPAFLLARCGNGEALVTNAHPELNPYSHAIVKGSLSYLLKQPIDFQLRRKPFKAKKVSFFTGGLGGKQAVEEYLALDSQEDLDVIPMAISKICEGGLDHVEVLFVPHGDPSRNEMLNHEAVAGFIEKFKQEGGLVTSDLTMVH